MAALLRIGVIAALVAMAACPQAVAQTGAGAERYEVTITPPRRPGSEPPADAAPAAGEVATPEAAAGAAGGDGSVPADGTAPADVTGAAVSAPAPGAGATAAPADAPLPKPHASLPLRTLQVGAFRQSKSADSLRDALAGSFPDVSIVEVQSGGEPLYRVYVGRMPKSPALDDLRRKLVAAGHPAFEVPAPSVPVPQ